MLENKNLDTSKDITPICHSNFFRNPHSEKYVEINTCKSFSKSNQKKLKLINDSKSLQKRAQQSQHKRKIRPMKVRVNRQENIETNKEGLCSIKQFKAKINRITQELSIKTPVKYSTQHTDISQSFQTARNMIPQSAQNTQCQTFGSKGTITSLTYMNDPFPTLSNSLVVHEGAFNPQSLVQTQNSIPSNNLSNYQSPNNQQFESVRKLMRFHTPIKQRNGREESDISTREKTEKKERLTLNMARKVQTHQTLKTQNEICHSVVEENEYKKFFDNLAFPDYFSPKFKNKQNPQRSAINNINFKSYL